MKARAIGIDAWQYGAFTAVRGDSLFFRLSASPNTEHSVALTQLDAIGVNYTHGSRHSYAGRGALIGFGVGLTAVGVMAIESRNSPSCCGGKVDPSPAGPATEVIAGLAFVVTGTLLGTLIGLTIHSDPYETVTPTSLTARTALRVTPSWDPTRRTGGLSVRLAF